MEELRGTGRTTAQAQALPYGAIFVVPHQGMASYMHRLLEYLGRPRDSLRIVTPAQLDTEIHRTGPTAWAIDHACWQYDGARAAFAYDLLMAWSPMMNGLLLCRFCGSPPFIRDIRVFYDTPRKAKGIHPMKRVECACGAISKCRPDEESARMAWNEPWQAMVL